MTTGSLDGVSAELVANWAFISVHERSIHCFALLGTSLLGLSLTSHLLIQSLCLGDLLLLVVIHGVNGCGSGSGLSNHLSRSALHVS